MIKCPFCQSTHVDNTIFCDECGSYLLESHKRDTDLFEIEAINATGNNFNQVEPAESLQSGTGPMTLQLKIGGQQREVLVILNKIVYLGRLDPASNIFPDVDLTPDGVQAQSVSRRHAEIFRQGLEVVVEDLGSVNGTFVNGKRLDPYLPEPLRDGDILQLGKLLIKVSIRGK